MLPSIGEPNQQAAARHVLPLLMEEICNGEKHKNSRHLS